MFDYHARRRNLAPHQSVCQALFFNPGSDSPNSINVSKAFINHMRGKRSRAVALNSGKHTLIDSDVSRTAAPLNYAAARFLEESGSKRLVVRGPAWVLLEEERWFCLWHVPDERSDLRARIEQITNGKFICETVRLAPAGGDVTVWQRWLFQNERDYLAASKLTGMQPCEEISESSASIAAVNEQDDLLGQVRNSGSA